MAKKKSNPHAGKAKPAQATAKRSSSGKPAKSNGAPKKQASAEKTLALHEIKVDPDVQPRAKSDSEVIIDYAERLKAGDKFPRIVVFFDGEVYWLAAGFHRLEAHIRNGDDEIECLVHPGTKEDAQWHALQSNKGHGLRPSNADKARAVKMAFAHPNGAKKSDRAVAELLGVSPTMVAKYRPSAEPTAKDGQSTTKRVGRDGRTTNTAKIGKAKRGNGKKPKAKPAADAKNNTAEPQADTVPAKPAASESDADKHASPEAKLIVCYREMLENQPSALDALVSNVDTIAGKAMAPSDANARLAKMIVKLMVLSTAEEERRKEARQA